MKIWGSADILNKKEMDLIENGMFEIFSEVGFKVENFKQLAKKWLQNRC